MGNSREEQPENCGEEAEETRVGKLLSSRLRMNHGAREKSVGVEVGRLGLIGEIVLLPQNFSRLRFMHRMMEYSTLSTEKPLPPSDIAPLHLPLPLQPLIVVVVCGSSSSNGRR